mmetsp:Transcript_244/g.323  ORF Transcript_244/g.323 Transcript_244/m.323 type:complete len:343 (-) Transcript_244:207-1235(-)
MSLSTTTASRRQCRNMNIFCVVSIFLVLCTRTQKTTMTTTRHSSFHFGMVNAFVTQKLLQRHSITRRVHLDGPQQLQLQRQQQRKYPFVPLQSSLDSNNQSSPSLDKLETKAVQRFTIAYDKLCKTCPTRIKPRVDTLAEMIMGLHEIERQELLSIVSQRMKHEEFSNIKNDKDVYMFQTEGYTTKKDKLKVNRKKEDDVMTFTVTNVDSNNAIAAATKQTEQQNSKLRNKISKTKSKYNQYKQKLIETQHLVSFITKLLSPSTTTSHHNLPEDGGGEDTQDIAIYHKMDELKSLQNNRTELKMERLKLMAVKAKLEQKIAKSRMKLYGANLKLIGEEEKVL